VIFSALVTSNYPQFLALFVLIFVQLVYTVASIFLFDYFNLWIPLFASVVSCFATYIIFISFQLTLKDYMNVQLEKERQFLFDVEELKNNFLSLISHDLKTPIAKIQAICDRMLAEAPSSTITGDVTSLREEASELHRYIQTILQITRVESRDFRIKKDASDINEIISTAVGKLQVLAKNKKIDLVLDLEPMFLIEVDAVLMREVVLNLIENAIKYTQEGGRVVVSSREIEDQVYVMVEDNGPGVPKEEQERIFDKFYRGELGKNQPKGSGLGLYLVKYFVELHSGKIIFDSEPKRGTKVGFRLPLADEPGILKGTNDEAVS
jgi:K+-sensing histidine kinase KdpD